MASRPISASGGRRPADTSRPPAKDRRWRAWRQTRWSDRSAPGTESFKQDRSNWESLRRDVDRALEQREASVSKRLASTLAEARMSAGGSDRVPEAYRQSIAKYYESLAKVKK